MCVGRYIDSLEKNHFLNIYLTNIFSKPVSYFSVSTVFKEKCLIISCFLVFFGLCLSLRLIVRGVILVFFLIVCVLVGYGFPVVPTTPVRNTSLKSPSFTLSSESCWMHSRIPSPLDPWEWPRSFSSAPGLPALSCWLQNSAHPHCSRSTFPFLCSVSERVIPYIFSVLDLWFGWEVCPWKFKFIN